MINVLSFTDLLFDGNGIDLLQYPGINFALMDRRRTISVVKGSLSLPDNIV